MGKWQRNIRDEGLVFVVSLSAEVQGGMASIKIWGTELAKQIFLTTLIKESEHPKRELGTVGDVPVVGKDVGIF